MKSYNVKVVFSYRNIIGSKLIQWGSKLFHKSCTLTIPSHVAVVVDDNWAIESVMFGGVRMLPYEKWKSINIEVASFDVSVCKEPLLDVVNDAWGKKYDFVGLLWFLKCYVCHKVTGKAYPTKNTLESEDRYFCTELAGRILGMDDYSMLTPVIMLERLRSSK